MLVLVCGKGSCMTSELQGQLECPRCGERLPDYAVSCHRCGLRLDPGVAYFPTQVAGTAREAEASATKAPAAAYESKRLSCLPMDLERIARAEAVDGWQLLDTTVDTSIQGNILANFQRRKRSTSPGERPETEKRKVRPAPRAKAKRVRSAPKTNPRPNDESGARDVRDVLYILLLVMGFIFLVSRFEFIGLIFGLFILPGLLRSMLGLKRRKRRRGRRR